MPLNSPSSYFGAPPWEPLCSVGSHDGAARNAQICISLFSASIVSDRPRLAAILWKSNYTHELVTRSGTMAVTLLGVSSLALLEPLGLRTGRDGPKLEGLEVATTANGDPYFPTAVGYADCRVLDAMDLGDATLFVSAVEAEERLSSEEPATWAEAQRLLDDGFLDRYRAKFAGDVGWATARMRWLPQG